MLFEGLLCSEATHLPLTQQGPQSHSRGTRHAFLCRYGNLSYFADPTAATASLQAYLQGYYNSYPAQRVAHRVVPRRLRQCNQQLCIHVRHLRPAGHFSSERHLSWTACLPCAHCKCSLIQNRAASSDRADVHMQCCPGHSERRASACLTVTLSYTKDGLCYGAGVLCCL